MKKTVLLVAGALMLLSSCATITNGTITDCQKTRPAAGQPRRHVKIWAILLDGPIGLVVDFSNGAIYKKGKAGDCK